ncbi:extracellular solute-binding protein [Alteribacillus sp. HJP-4]|uniref:extracellular solute-binding protein n=1 Tax=Alteribacillus sp. HJP-4 TaxID=2775394 RepID=UPI0035CD0BE1
MNVLKLVGFGMITIFMLSACTGGGQIETGGEEGEEGSDSDEGGSSSESSGDKEVIEFWYIDAGAKEEVYLEAIERFEEENPDVEVEALRIANDDYKQRMVVAMSGGNPPDVFHSWGGGWLGEFVEGGQVKDLTDEDIDFDRFQELALDNSIYDGQNHGVPLDLTLTLMFYNKEMFEEYDLEEPETYDELLTIIDELNENDIDPIALTNQTSWPGSYYYMYFADRLAGEELFQDAMEGEGDGFADEAYVQAGEHIQELVERDAFNNGFNGIPYDAGQGRQLMYSDQAAMMLMTTSFLNNVRDEYPEMEEKLGVFPFPVLEDGEGDPSNLNGAVSPVWSIYEGTEHSDHAVELINHLTSDETVQEFIDRTGAMSALKEVETDDPFIQEFLDLVDDANHIQMPYDQTLDPDLAQPHLETTQELFGGDISPEEAAEVMQQAAEETEE